MTLRRRIVLTLLPLLALFSLLGGAGMSLIYRLGTRIDAILRENFDSVIAMERLGDAVERIDSSYQFTLAGQEARARLQHEANWKTFRENLRFEQGNITLPGEKELVDELTNLTERYEQQGQAFFARAVDDPRRRADYFDAGGLLESFTKIKSIAGQIARMNQDNMEQASRAAHETAARSLVAFGIGLAACIALAALATWHVFHAVLGPIRAVTKSAEGVGSGNLDQVVPYLSGDALGELAAAFNRMAARLREERHSTKQRTQELLQTTETLRGEISEREKMERELRQMATVVQSSDDAIVIQDMDGIITSWNKGAERIFGHSAQWIIGQPQSILVPPDQENELPAIRARIQRGEHVEQFETVRKTKNDRRIFVSLTISPVKDETGKVIGVASIGRDVTERKKAEEALKNSEENLKQAQAVAHVGSWHLDVPNDELYWSDESYRIFGVALGTPMTYEKFLASVHPDDRELVDKAWTAALRGQPYEVEHRILVNGQERWIHEKAKLEFDWQGHVVTGIGTAHDITERKQAEARIHRLAQLQSAVAEWGLRALRAESTVDLLDDSVGVVVKHIQVDLCNVLELLPGGEELLLRAGAGWKDGVVGHATVTAQGTQPGFVIRSERPVIVADAATETRFQLLPRLLGEPVASAMSVVIATPEGPYGALGAHSRRARTFTPDEVDFLQAVANVLGSAIQRKRSEERLRRSNRALLALSSCNQALIRASDENNLVQQVCQIVVEKAGYRLCWVGFAEQDEAKTVRPVAQAGLEEDYLKTVNITWADVERGHGPTGTCIRTGEPLVVKDIASEIRFAPWRAEALKRGYRSCVGIPLSAEAKTLGAFTIYAAEPDAFNDDEVRLLSELADDLAFGIVTLRSKAERKKAVELQAAHERDLKIGSEIQKSLLVNPLPTDLCGLRVAALSVPSRQIDGDFYYFYRHDDRRVDVIVADVMGKGIPAALLGAATKSQFLETLCHLLDVCPAGVLPQPKEIVTRAHAAMARHLMDLESFVTLCYVRIDMGRRTIEFVDAGHTGIIRCKAATGRCEVLHGDNLPLGFREGETYNQQLVSYASGDLLVLYSDGVTEARNPADELFGEKRLIDCIERSRTLKPDELATAIRNAVFSFAELTTPTDDLTCVVMAMDECEHALAHARLELLSDLRELARARDFVRACCRDLPGPTPDETFVGSLELAITEACSNIMKHALTGHANEVIQMTADAYADRITVRISHRGEPFDPASVPMPRFDGTQESGFGVYLITQNVDEARYSRDEQGRNCIALTKRRQPAPVRSSNGNHG
jgi:PAS domain S-box-containing protein